MTREVLGMAASALVAAIVAAGCTSSTSGGGGSGAGPIVCGMVELTTGGTTVGSSSSTMDPTCVEHPHGCSVGEGCNCPPGAPPPGTRFCDCFGSISAVAACHNFGYVPDASKCSRGTFECGDQKCKRDVEFCMAAPPGSATYAVCVPAPASCPFGVTSCGCVATAPDEKCRDDFKGGITVGCVCEPTPSSTCGTDGTCDANGSCMLWPEGTTCSACSASGTCTGAGSCSAPASGCTDAVCSGDACVTIQALSGGWGHACALTSAGGVECWGSGYLGNGASFSQSAVPVPVRSLSSGVAAIASGGSESCALMTSGGAKCWGVRPRDVEGFPANVTSIVAGSDHVCALASGDVYCWGQGNAGQMGNCSSDPVLVPTRVKGLPADVVAISAGSFRTCAVSAGGAVWCWGTLGKDISTVSFAPVLMAGLASGVASVSSGYYHDCAVTKAGAVLCWGDNEAGQLGDGSTVPSAAPVAVVGASSGMASVAVGISHTCALSAAGAVTCWGDNAYGQLGTGSKTSSSSPVPVVGLSSGVASIAASPDESCALTTAGRVECWGANVLVPTSLPR